jgi:very-short-patch-repair endonuclease
VGGYILDFYCPMLKFGIELDGSQHAKNETVLYDRDREKYLQASNIHIIRFWNSDVMKNAESVLEKIGLEINNSF